MDNTGINPKAILAGIGAILILIFLIIFWPLRTVDAGNLGVVTIWGHVQKTTLQPGIHLINPIGTSVVQIPTRVQLSSIKGDNAATKDLQQVTADFAVNWHIESSDITGMYSSVGDENTIYTNIIAPAVSEVLKSETAKFDAQDLISNRLQLKQDIDTLLAQRLAKYNVQLDDVNLTNFDFSSDFDKAIEAKQVAQQQAAQAQYDLQKAQLQAQANSVQSSSLSQQVLEQQWIQKWDGHVPSYVGSGSDLFFGLNATK